MIVVPTPTPPQLFSAKQVRLIDPAQNGTIHFVDGSAENFLVTTGTPPETFVPTASGNVVPNPGDWILNTRPLINTASGGPGQQSFAALLQLPLAPNPNGPFLVIPQAQFAAQYQDAYGQGEAGRQGVVV